MGGEHPLGACPPRDLARPTAVHVHVRLGLIGGEAHLTQQQIHAAGALNDRFAQVGIAGVEQSHRARRILLRRPLDAQAESLNRMQRAIRAHGQGTHLVGVTKAKLGECKLALVSLGLRRALDLPDARECLRGPEQRQRRAGGTRPPLAIHLQGNDVAHVVRVTVRQGQRVQVPGTHVPPQGTEGARADVTHERERPFLPRGPITSAGLNQVGGCGRFRTRHGTGRTDDGELHAIPPPVRTRPTDPTSGPRKRLANSGKASEAPVARN